MIWTFLFSPLRGEIYNENGRSFTEIVVAAEAPASTNLAAKEMQKYLKLICGQELPIVHHASQSGLPIFIGQSEALSKFSISASNMRNDEFKIFCNSNALVIAGKDYSGPPVCGLRTPLATVWNPQLQLGQLGSTGTLFGVYNFLEKYCGVRWYMPGSLGTVIPENKKLTIPEINYSRHPAFSYRFAYFCNDISQKPEAILWYRRLGFGGAPNIEINHSFSLFSKYIKTNPDYFALVDGERDFNYVGKCATSGGGPQLCLTNPRVVDQWVNDICEYFAKNPEENCYPVCPGDELKRVCECPQCRLEVDKNASPGKKFSNHIWRFINRVAEKVAAKYPDKYIGCFAYDTYCYPPDFNLHSNVIVMICKKRGLFVDQAYKRAVRESISRWLPKVSSPIYFWEYYLDHWDPWQNLPIIYPHIIKDDIKYMQSIKSGGEKIEAGQHPAIGKDDICYPGMQHLNLYVTAKLQWDPDLDVDQLLEEYFTLFYGPARNEMREFWSYAEKVYAEAGAKHQRDMSKHGISLPFQRAMKPKDVFTTQVLARLDALLNTAIGKTVPGSVYRLRVETIQKEFASGRKRLIGARSLKPSELILPKSAKTGNETIIYSTPSYFRDNIDNTVIPAAQQTSMTAAEDKSNIYFRFVCFEDKMDHLKMASVKADDDLIWNDDCIELFLCPDLTAPKVYYQIVVNPAGTVWDGKYADGGSPDSKWQSGAKVQRTISADRWSLEIQIPLKSLGLDNRSLSGKGIGANFYRNRHTAEGTQYFAWSPTGVIDHNCNSAAKFGTIKFN